MTRRHRERTRPSLALSLLADVHYAVRSFGRTPVFMLMAGLTLALGVSGATTMFSVVNAVLLRPLGYPQPERLVHVVQADARGALDLTLPGLALSHPDLQDLRDHSSAIEGLAAWQGWGFLDETPEGARTRRRGGSVSPDFFHVLGVEAEVGRVFDSSDDEATVVVSNDFWRTRMGADPGAVGGTVTLDQQAYFVVGVMPAGFVDPVASLVSRQFDLDAPEAWRLVRFERRGANRGNTDVWSVGRLAPGATLEGARDELEAISRRLREAYPETNESRTFSVVTVRDALVSDVRSTLLVLLGAVSILLLIASANVANLFLSRSTTREREMAVRIALGAPHGRLVRQLLTEAAVFAIVSGGVGLLLSWLSLSGLRRAVVDWLPRADTVSLDLRVVAFALGVSLLTAVSFGLAPAVHATGRRLGGTLRVGRDGASRSGERLRAAFAVGQIALTVVLLAGMGLVFRTFVNLSGEDLGLDVRNVVAVEVALDPVAYRTAPDQNAVVDAVERELAELPGALRIGMVNALPMSGQIDATPVVPEERREMLEEEIDRLPRHPVRAARPGYFAAVGIPVLVGRAFGPVDGPDARPVAVVNQALADRLFPEEQALGRRVVVRGVTLDIVGVVGNVRHFGPARPAEPALYTSYEQELHAWMRGTVSFVVRTAPDGGISEAALRRAVASAGPALTVVRVRGLEELLQAHLAAPRFRLMVATGFAGLALLLATVGVGAVVAFGVARRAREYAVRTACGATRADILTAVLARTTGLLAIGLGIGWAISLISGRFVHGFLHGVSPADPLVSIGVTATLVIATLLAAALPTRRTLSDDPARVLRED